MNNEGNNERDNNEFVMFLRTILTVLENHNFRTTTQVFKDECLRLGYNELFTNYKGSNTSSNPKIILENFSSTQPYRIVVENFSKTEQESSKPNLDYNLPNIPNICNPDITITECTPTKESSVSDNAAQTNFSDSANDNFVAQQPDNFNSKASTPDTAVINDYCVLKRRFSNLQVEHQKLMDVVTELTFALQTSIKGQIDETKIILNNCERMYPELFFKKPLPKSSEIVIVNTITAQQSEKIVREIKPNNGPIHNVLDFISNNVCKCHGKILVLDIDASDDEISNLYRPKFSLDYQKIKYDLKNSDLPTKILLLQALRWRITKTSDSIRESVVRGYVRHDILNIHNCSQKSSSNFPKNSIVFSSFYCSCSSPQALQQSVARFVNALASLKIGRDYIVLKSVILNILLTVLLSPHSKDQIMDDVTRDMIIATLQKVSLRYSVRMLIISEGLTEHMTEFLVSNYKNLNEYCLEYSIALLRNLWLHNEAREKCKIQAHDILKLLANLLHEQYHFCLPYITGSLYNLLPDPRFNKAAKEINLEEFIVDRVKTLQGDLKEQLQYILEIYLNPDSWQPLCECDLGTDSENEIDIVELEIDQNEDLSDAVTDGEKFLYSYRRAYSIDASNISPTCINNMFSAPVTPNLNSLPSKHNKLLIEENTQINNKILNIPNEMTYKNLLPKEENIANDIKKETIESDYEMTFCEDTQQLCYVPSKNGIFEPDRTYSMHTYSPSFIKNIGEYDSKNISKSVPASPRNKNSENAYSPTYSGTCYREGFQPKSFSDNSTPHIGFCKDVTKSTNNNHMGSKYSCACFLEMQKSFDDDKKLVNKNNNDKSNDDKTNSNVEKDITDTAEINVCKYKCYPTSNSAPTTSSPKIDRDIGTSKSLDEADYTAVFESRPKILRTP